MKTHDVIHPLYGKVATLCVSGDETPERLRELCQAKLAELELAQAECVAIPHAKFIHLLTPFRVPIECFVRAVNQQALLKMKISGKAEGAHYAALSQLLKEIQEASTHDSHDATGS